MLVVDLLKILNWEGTIDINGTIYNSSSEIPRELEFNNNMSVTLIPKETRRADEDTQASDKEFRVTVRKYMTKQSTPSFDFMARWNDDVPMPLMTMIGTIEKETPGMYYMHLRADTSFTTVDRCMNCGKVITNPVSKYFGMGPECGRHNYVNPFNSDAELKEAVDTYKREVLSKITWSGWVIKSAITEMEEIV